MTVYYNENDAYAAQWLENLIVAGHIATGVVDQRSIIDVRPDDLAGYDQCHFFAGIGGWSLALRMAGWPDDRPVWTGSCPCQPFSTAGQGKAADDDRHLWPAWMALIRKRHPTIVFGEQVEAAIGWGWLDLVFTDLEQEGYACGASVLPACGVGAPHIRNRLWFVADACQGGRRRWTEMLRRETGSDVAGSSPWLVTMADGFEPGWQGRLFQRQDTERRDLDGYAGRGGAIDHWSDLEWIACSDGKARPVKPGIFPLAHGISARVGKLRAAGNAIVPQIAAEFIRGCGV